MNTDKSYRYLIYAIDKHQSSPEFRNDLPDWVLEDSEYYFDVVVDLVEKKRFWYGEWEPVDCYPSEDLSIDNENT